MAKKTQISVLLVMIAALILGGCGKRPANHYRKIDIGSRHEIVGRFPVDDETAAKINCYHFIYDKNHKLVTVEFQRNGRLDYDSYLGVARVIIEYSEGFEKWMYQDAKGRPIEYEDAYSIRLKLNESGYPTSMFLYNKDGELAKDKNGVSQYLWTCDGKGRRVNAIRLDKNGERITDSNGLYESRWKYDKEGNVLERRFYGTDEQLRESNDGGVAIVKNKYDGQGNKVEISYYGTDEQLKENKIGVLP
jgi:hypothetical protein